MEVNVLEFKNGNHLVKSGELNRSFEFSLNGDKMVNVMRNNDLILSKDDVLCYIPRQNTIVNYIREGVSMSTDEYQSKPQYHDEENTDDEIIEAINNRRELEGFKPVYEKVEPTPVSINVVGFIEDTGSKFISCAIKCSQFTKVSNVYSISGRLISLDEYEKLSNEFSDHARFGTPDRPYLRFTKINGKYAFEDFKPFGDREYFETFTQLEDAKEAEEKTRERVRNKVNLAVFKNEITAYKNNQILTHLKIIKKTKTVKAKNELLYMLISDLSEYLMIIYKD